MWDKFTKLWKENMIFHFLASHLAILLLALLICVLGFQSALSIVRQDTLNSAEFVLAQGVHSFDIIVEELRTVGMQTVRSESLRALKQTRHGDREFYFKADEAIDDISQRMLYYSINWADKSFIYLEDFRQILFNGSMYDLEIFERYLKKWEIDEALWQASLTNERTKPYFCTFGNNEMYYIIPIVDSWQGNNKWGTIFFRITEPILMKCLRFLNKYPQYSLIIQYNGETLYIHDDLSAAYDMDTSWFEQGGTWINSNRLIMSAKGDLNIGLNYLLMLPEQEAMRELVRLRIVIIALLFGAVLFGTVMSICFSLRHGRPVNDIAWALSDKGSVVNVDLRYISSAVSKLLQENANLVQAQEQDLSALQNTFFHNLLKSDFISRAEMEYMAQRADIRLTEKTYCAATLRLFPNIDVDAIDGQTVEDARVLQPAIRTCINEMCARPVWSYKRNTLETLYIFEIRDQTALLRILRDTALWLHDKYHIDARWGVGTPCNDLMQFWCSAEESTVALISNAGKPVQLYNRFLIGKDSYYFPYTVEERIIQGLRAGDVQSVKDVLLLLWQENFVNRNLTRYQLLRFNHRMVEILSVHLECPVEDNPDLMELDSLAGDYSGEIEPYFEKLNLFCHVLCEQASAQKSTRRSENVQAIEEYIRQQYRDPDLGLGKVSAAFELSEGYLSAIFKKETGINFADYVEQLRIHAACALLEDGARVSSLPEQVGYNSVQSFRRAFKRVTGVSPSKYREV